MRSATPTINNPEKYNNMQITLSACVQIVKNFNVEDLSVYYVGAKDTLSKI